MDKLVEIRSIDINGTVPFSSLCVEMMRLVRTNKDGNTVVCSECGRSLMYVDNPASIPKIEIDNENSKLCKTIEFLGKERLG